MVIVVESGLGYTNLNSKRHCLQFQIALIPLRKIWIQQFSVQQWVYRGADWALTLIKQPVLKEENSEFKLVVDQERDGLRLVILA